MTEDAELLTRYATERAEVAFAEFTRRHVDLVYSAALRLMNGDVAAAQDVTQQVFTEAARQAGALARHPALVGWLHTTTRLIALRARRTEQRRKYREQEAHAMIELLHDDAPPAEWDRLRPVIDEAVHQLDEKDRHAVLLRFFQNKSLREVGRALNLRENAARMRVERALEKLRRKLASQGITTTATGLAVLLSANAVEAAPAGLATTLVATALAGSTLQASTWTAVTGTIAMTTFQKTIVAVAVAAAIGTGFYAVHHGSRLKAEIRRLQEQQEPLNARLRQLEQEQAQAARQVAALGEQNARLRSGRDERELLRLRGEVGVLRQRAGSNEAHASPSAGGLAQLLTDPATKEYMRKAMMDKMRSLYEDLIAELKLTPEQTEQLVELLSGAGSRALAQLTAAHGGTRASQTEAAPDTTSELRALLGDAGSARFKEFSQELPARATLALLKGPLGSNPLSEEQRAHLIQAIKVEPDELTRGIIGSPDQAFQGSQPEIDAFLEQVTQSNQRVLQRAGAFLTPGQLTVLDSVLTKGVEARKLQGAAFFPPKR